ncbi:MAG: tetratricopeptide repeat protein [Chthoniobacterales bacterium]|jgi:tetratricopeptide (TPR) repeat protein
MNRLPVVLSAAALAGVVLLYFLYLGQRGESRELRAMINLDRANAALNANAGAQAEEYLAQVYELAPETPNLWRRRAVARMMSGQTQEAINAAKEHLRANPGDTGISALLGAAQIMSQQLDDAELTLTSALQIAPNQRDLVQNLSELRRLQKRPADAAALIDGFLAQNPADGFFQYKRAMADVAGELPDGRRQEIQEAIAGGNATAGIYVVAAAIDFRDGKPDEARLKLEEANKRASAQDLRTMLEDEFFRDHIQFNPAGGQAPAQAPAATPAASPAPAADED